MAHWSVEIGTEGTVADQCGNHLKDLPGGLIPMGGRGGGRELAAMPPPVEVCGLGQTGGGQEHWQYARCGEELTVAGRTGGP